MPKDTKAKNTPKKTESKATPKTATPVHTAPKPSAPKSETPKVATVAKPVVPKAVAPAAPDPKVRNKKIHEVCKDIMDNEFWALSHAEAHPIAIKMVDESAEHIRTVVKYFSFHEREKLCNELAQKHNLTRSKWV